MPTYISLIQYTQQGLQKIKESPARLDHAKKGYEAAGGKIKDFYLVMGEYDIVVVAELLLVAILAPGFYLSGFHLLLQVFQR